MFKLISINYFILGEMEVEPLFAEGDEYNLRSETDFWAPGPSIQGPTYSSRHRTLYNSRSRLYRPGLLLVYFHFFFFWRCSNET